jgi:crotonobetainyl-CoA:carnitine CoA-transferase CaiB-like acyl-CoA transferase
MDEATRHPHNVQRGTFIELNGVTQPAPAPRFSATPAGVPGAVPRRGEHGVDILRSAGLSEAEIAQLLAGD